MRLKGGFAGIDLALVVGMTYRHKYRLTALASLVTTTLLFCAWCFQLDLLETIILGLEKLEHLKIHALILPAFVGAGALSIDLWIANRKQAVEAKIQEQRLRMMQTTVRTLQHVVNNYLNNMQLFRPEEEGLGSESLELFDTLNQRVAESLKRLGDLSEPREKETGAGPVLDYSGFFG